ncbi:Asparagine synthetase [glutamine-hydrolyzing] [Zostera marina]|uniref:Asparagine synthetase [glutamine-hydrolyzing] n=1 Tax=Zostera marina TaxID=29655 RepID=A0A0K9NQ98_ZOSMR|nr:Asparagine synthetase [glutamine-hydrolyzing] [Zostera marina]
MQDVRLLFARMCGILVVLGCSDESQAKRVRILQLSRRLKHRGPDWSGIYQYRDNYLSHQRLAIIDLASGDQPLYNEDKSIAVTVTGEIYNHKDLRQNLSSKHTFRTNSDCDVIAHLYEEHGEDFVDMLDGVFSFVLLDTRDNSFLAARDAVGVTPLYIGWGLDGSVWISSEMKGLNDDCEHFEIFPPGNLYSSKTGGFRRWYNPSWFSEMVPCANYEPLVLRKAFEDAVIKRLMTDVPFGVLLSGGLDSSLVAAVTCRHLEGTKVAKQWGTKLHSFSIGLKGSPDMKAAREVAEYLDTVHYEFYFTVQDGIDVIEDVIHHIETYDDTTIRASIPMFLMSRKIKALGVKMVISGDGSDEIFGGYLYFHKAPNKEEFHVETCHKKEQFCDGVGYNWIDGMKAHAYALVTDKMMQNARFIYPHNTPTSKEAYHYRVIFERLFPQHSARLTVSQERSIACSTAKAVEWDAEWSKFLDPSGRAILGVHTSAFDRR